ncbi:MAG: ferritin family protein [Clostridia bacterium]
MIKPIIVDLPYPEVTPTEQNMHDVKLLMPNYGGKGSETTAIFQYTYQHYILHGVNEHIADTLLGIGLAEMSHHEKLAESIVNLKGDPVIAGGYNWWTGANVNYTKQIKNIILTNIIDEQNAIKQYEQTNRFINNMEVKALIDRIIMDEELHIIKLKELLKL